MPSIVVYPLTGDTRIVGAGTYTDIDDPVGATNDSDYVANAGIGQVTWNLEGLNAACASIPDSALIQSVTFLARIKTNCTCNFAFQTLDEDSVTRYLYHETSLSSQVSFTDISQTFTTWPRTGGAWTKGILAGTAAQHINYVTVDFNPNPAGSGKTLEMSQLHFIVNYLDVDDSGDPIPAITWSDAIKDPNIPLVWGLTVSNQAVEWTDAFGERPFSVGGTIFHDGLRVITPPSITIDPYSCVPSVTDAMVELAPVREGRGALLELGYPYEIEHIRTTPAIGWIAKLYLYPLGGEGAALRTMLLGTVTQAELINGVMRLTISDMTEYYDRDLPYRIVDTSVWPDAREDDRGSGVPILYGTVQSSECPVIKYDPTGVEHWGIVAMTHGLFSKDTIYRNEDTAESITWQEVADPYGADVTAFTFTAAPGTDRFFFWGSGERDTSSGRYQGGSAYAFLTNPIAQLWALLERHGGIPSALFDESAWQTVRSAFGAWEGAIQIGAHDSTTLWNVRDDVTEVTRCAVYWEEGKLTIRFQDLNAVASFAIVEGLNLISVDSIDYGRKEDILSRIDIKYKWAWNSTSESMDYLGGLSWNEYTDTLLANNSVWYGKNSKEINSKVLYGDPSATMNYLYNIHSLPRKIVNLTADKSALSVKPFDVITLDYRAAPGTGGAGWVAKPFLVTALTRGPLSVGMTLLEVQHDPYS